MTRVPHPRKMTTVKHAERGRLQPLDIPYWRCEMVYGHVTLKRDTGQRAPRRLICKDCEARGARHAE